MTDNTLFDDTVSDDEFGRRLSIALHDAVPQPPAELLADIDGPDDLSVVPVRPAGRGPVSRRSPITRRATPWLAAAAVVAVGATAALVVADHRGGNDRPDPAGSRPAGPVVSCVLGNATVGKRTVTARQTRLTIRLAVATAPACRVSTRPEVDFIGTDNLPFLPAVTYTAAEGQTIRVTGRAAQFTLVLDAGCARPQHYASLSAGTQYGGVAPLALSGDVCSAEVGDFRSVR